MGLNEEKQHNSFANTPLQGERQTIVHYFNQQEEDVLPTFE